VEIQFLCIELSLLTENGIHEIAEQSAVFNGTGQCGLSRLFWVSISNHLPYGGTEGLQSRSQKPSTLPNRVFTAHLQNILIENRSFPLVLA
jgi:hypothetical protein